MSLKDCKQSDKSKVKIDEYSLLDSNIDKLTGKMAKLEARCYINHQALLDHINFTFMEDMEKEI